MSHVRIWRFRPPHGGEAAFAEAYGPQGEWARLFTGHEGFVATELWRAADGSFLTVDRWASEGDFVRFKQQSGNAYRALDELLEGIAGDEQFLGAYETD